MTFREFLLDEIDLDALNGDDPELYLLRHASRIEARGSAEVAAFIRAECQLALGSGAGSTIGAAFGLQTLADQLRPRVLRDISEQYSRPDLCIVCEWGIPRRIAIAPAAQIEELGGEMETIRRELPTIAGFEMDFTSPFQLDGIFGALLAGELGVFWRHDIRLRAVGRAEGCIFRERWAGMLAGAGTLHLDGFELNSPESVAAIAKLRSGPPRRFAAAPAPPA